MTENEVTVTQADEAAAREAYAELTGYAAEDMRGDWLARRFAQHRTRSVGETNWGEAGHTADAVPYQKCSKCGHIVEQKP